MTMFTKKRYELLDTFRGMAILWIVAFHFSADFRGQYADIFDNITRYGLGVTVFFVISGFGAASSLEKALRTGLLWYKYLLKRAERIYVPYWYSIVFSALIIPFIVSLLLMIYSHSFNPELVQYSFWEWVQTITLLKVFSATGWELNLAFLPLNGVIWYLAVIIQIYIVIAISLCFKDRYPLILFGVFLASLLTLVPEIKEILPYGIFLPYFSQFYLGFIVNALIAKGIEFNPRSKTHLAVAVCLLIGIAFLMYVYPEPFSYSFLVAFMFWVLHRYDEMLFTTRIGKIFFIIGIFSYSLYLLHMPLWPLVGMVVGELVSPYMSVIVGLLIFMCVILLSSVWYLFFEKPVSIVEVIGCLKSPVRTLSGYKQLLKPLREAKL